MFGAYGHGAVPRIAGGTTSTSPAAITVENASHLVVQDLEVSGGYWQNVHVRSDDPNVVMSDLTFRGLVLDGNAWVPPFNQWVLGTGGLIVEPCTYGARITGVSIADVVSHNQHETGVQIGHSPMRPYDPASSGGGMNTPDCHMDVPAGGTFDHSGVTNVVLQNSSLHDNDASGAQIFYSSHVTLQHNTLFNNGSGAGANIANSSGMNGEGAWWANTDHVTAEYNNAYGNRAGRTNNDGSGLDPDVSTSQNLIQYNWLHDNENYGVSVIAGNSASVDTVIRYNVMSNNGTDYPNAPDVMVSNPYHTGGVQGLAVYNNTLTRAGGGQGIRLQSNFLGDAPVTVANNIVYRTTPGQLISTTTADAVVDHNDFFVASGAPTFAYAGVSYGSLSAYQQATGQDRHSAIADPQLAEPTYAGTAYPTRPAFVPAISSPVRALGSAVADNGGFDFYHARVRGTDVTTVGAVIAGRAF
ncbi:right-handed parallel beta-helix repeat-containing protein [Arthrobacter dokdonensis]|uniref:right-handed parallel beta-helix repeat-containing protein n=1 Tax=Arthrobacter dokdonellae TaxID=2211210 RepID=UPI001493EDD2|nr:right-handed parallel beta-helix repeat-containing protein [Arthrobacter dokdonellae]